MMPCAAQNSLTRKSQRLTTGNDGRAALATVPYVPPRGNVADWGDDYGNRVDRFLACVADLDGRSSSLVMCSGYYTRTVLAAWNWRDGRLTHLEMFDIRERPWLIVSSRRRAGIS